MESAWEDVQNRARQISHSPEVSQSETHTGWYWFCRRCHIGGFKEIIDGYRFLIPFSSVLRLELKAFYMLSKQALYCGSSSPGVQVYRNVQSPFYTNKKTQTFLMKVTKLRKSRNYQKKKKQNIKEERCLIHFIINNIFQALHKVFHKQYSIWHHHNIILWEKKEIIAWLAFEPRCNFNSWILSDSTEEPQIRFLIGIR